MSEGFEHIRVQRHGSHGRKALGGDGAGAAAPERRLCDPQEEGADGASARAGAVRAGLGPAMGSSCGTALEDAERSPMPLAQKVIIVAAALAVIAFAVWQIAVSA